MKNQFGWVLYFFMPFHPLWVSSDNDLKIISNLGRNVRNVSTVSEVAWHHA